MKYLQIFVNIVKVVYICGGYPNFNYNPFSYSPQKFLL